MLELQPAFRFDNYWHTSSLPAFSRALWLSANSENTEWRFIRLMQPFGSMHNLQTASHSGLFALSQCAPHNRSRAALAADSPGALSCAATHEAQDAHRSRTPTADTPPLRRSSLSPANPPAFPYQPGQP